MTTTLSAGRPGRPPEAGGAPDSRRDAAPGLTVAARVDSADGAPMLPAVSLEIAAGAVTAILGRSGCGKSTTLRLIAGLIADARVTAPAAAVAATDGAPVGGRVAWMAQAPGLAPWLDLRGNVGFGAALRGESLPAAAVDAAIAAVGLGGLGGRRPDQISGGQAQRAALARLLVENRPIALLDEPFSALDALTREEMQDLAADALAGRTVVLVTHDPDEAARLADHAYTLGPRGAQRAAIGARPAGPGGARLAPPDDPGLRARAAALRADLRAAS